MLACLSVHRKADRAAYVDGVDVNRDLLERKRNGKRNEVSCVTWLVFLK